MSNVVLPKLNTILPPLPKENIIIPLDIISNNYDSFPPMKTPIIQEVNKNILTYPDLRGVVISEKFTMSKNNENYTISQDNNKNILIHILISIVIIIIIFLLIKKYIY
jgi:hypothetical protein